MKIEIKTFLIVISLFFIPGVYLIFTAKSWQERKTFLGLYIFLVIFVSFFFWLFTILDSFFEKIGFENKILENVGKTKGLNYFNVDTKIKNSFLRKVSNFYINISLKIFLLSMYVISGVMGIIFLSKFH